jgi:hypothetical protein
MDSFEEELKQALTRTDPDPGFEGRVASRLRARANGYRYYHSPWLRIAAAALVMLTGGSAWRYHQGQVARQQVLAALRLAGGKLSSVQSQLRGIQ